MIDSADAVIIGSGAFGASAAYHLARRGLKVAVLERAALFASSQVDERELRERCRRAYATHYRAGSETPAES